MKRNKWFVVLLIFPLLLLSGCTVYVAGTKKNPDFKDKIKEATVYTIAKKSYGIRISRSHTRRLRSDDKENASRGVKEILDVFKKHAANMVVEGLKKHKVSVVKKPAKDTIKFIMFPVSGRAECAPLGCNYSLNIAVNVISSKYKKPVWVGRFKVGAPFNGEQNADVIKQFTDSLFDELKSAELI
jgi:hypothetical protein